MDVKEVKQIPLTKEVKVVGTDSRAFMPGDVVQHFKGNLYQILTMALHTETQESMVVYQRLGNEGGVVYVRPYSMFTSKVDKEKYPEADGYRFTTVTFVREEKE